MKSPWIAGVRSVALNVPDLTVAERFYVDIWRLQVAGREGGGEGGVLYLRGTGADPYLLALHAAPQEPHVQIREVTLRARSAQALADVAQAAIAAGGRVVEPAAPVTAPGGGTAMTICDPHGRRLQVLHGDTPNADAGSTADRPQRLAHVVLNTHDVPATQAFLEQALGFVLADRTRIMAFMNCNDDHHSLALGDTDNDALNHIAFLMPDLESVMRGGGRMVDAGHAIEWGPGRHGPGDNAFNYFIGPFGEVIEYTGEVEQIDDSYAVRGPADWAWPAGRNDQWGISAPPSARLRTAQRSIHFIPSP
jgi:catechol 2,3-dioxygenase